VGRHYGRFANPPHKLRQFQQRPGYSDYLHDWRNGFRPHRSGLVLQDNGGNNLSVTGNGTFTFSTAVSSGGAYAVTVFAEPSNPLQNCVVTSGSGNASANVTSVQVTCTNAFTIGGNVLNLVGTGLVLQDNGGNNLSVTANGSFTFTNAISTGLGYAVTVSTPPSNPAQTCTVANGTGTANANVTGITVNCGHNEWEWVGGTNLNTVGTGAGSYGKVGVAAASNLPGVRNLGPVSWTDANGNLWLFGGSGIDSTGASGDLNDLWKYNISSGQWTWVSGSNTAGATGSYGVLNTPASSNVPGARDGAISWIDSSGNLWLFGGEFTPSGGSTVYFNDLWEYSVSANEWTWKGGSNTAGANGNYGTLNVASATNVPGARFQSVAQNISGVVWLFGGFGNDSTGGQGDLNDLWEYSISSGEWTWVGGSDVVTTGVNGVYGTKGTAATTNIPGARQNGASFADTLGNFWIFGGAGLDSAGTNGELNDLWEYSTVSKEWTWIGGANVANQNGVYGTQGTAASGNIPGSRSDEFYWTDPSGNFWIFGGFGNDSANPLVDMNDLWEYSVSANEWTWKNGPNVGDENGTYGTLGQLAPGNIPGNREGGANWADASGNLWLFGGSGTNAVNDLWMYFP
jgi:N-acetylneuraminic acid mutarotase